INLFIPKKHIKIMGLLDLSKEKWYWKISFLSDGSYVLNAKCSKEKGAVIKIFFSLLKKLKNKFFRECNQEFSVNDLTNPKGEVKTEWIKMLNKTNIPNQILKSVINAVKNKYAILNSEITDLKFYEIENDKYAIELTISGKYEKW
ncbi:MAG: hypothetical protein QXJ14_01995, partial [Candidatus Aenigmatarchaeota archaeon]